MLETKSFHLIVKTQTIAFGSMEFNQGNLFVKWSEICNYTLLDLDHILREAEKICYKIKFTIALFSLAILISLFYRYHATNIIHNGIPNALHHPNDKNA